jgi:hypothetical protein
MTNTATINISSPSGSHKVFMQQDADNKRTIHTWLDNAPHAITGCSANSDGTSLTGTTHIFIFNDAVSVQVDPASNAVTMDISGANAHYSGVLNPGEAAALVAFVKACGLPDLAA